MNDIPLIHMDERPITSIWYPGEDAGGYSTDARFDKSTSKIVAYAENGQCAPVPFYAVYDHDGNIKARVPAQMVTVIYAEAPKGGEA
ncbi:MAG: hypothetical protein BGO05_10155 [Rhizobiales bacterium 63-7]|nr:hypothetical protein [Hyphomicrobiales bacterium]OJU66200.1 MAG: hypothetical protein BGO05_10155 [Rhizobiales bacterium 63-7]